MIEVTEKPISADTFFKKISHEGSGSVVIHVGVVKPVVDDMKTRGIRLTREGDLEGELRKLEDRIRKNWEVNDVLLVRRLGELRVGDVIMIAAVSAPGRETAFGACKDAVLNLKKKLGLKKEELFEDT